MLPPTFIVSGEKFPNFACQKCSATTSWEAIERMQENIGMELSAMKKDDADTCRKFVDSQARILHENHFYNVDVKLALAQIIGQQEGGLPAVSDELLSEKIILCKKLSELLRTLVPGERYQPGSFNFKYLALRRCHISLHLKYICLLIEKALF